MVKNLSNQIIQFFCNLDASGKSADKIDTALEYTALSQYLSGKGYVCDIAHPIYEIYKNENINYYNSTERKNIDGNLAEIRQSLKETLLKSLVETDNLPEITVQNGQLYADIYSVLENQENLSADEKKLLSKIRESLSNFIFADGRIHYTCDYGYCMENCINGMKKTEELKQNGKAALKLVETPYNTQNLKVAVKNYLKNNNVSKINITTDLGNGKFDNVGIQDTEVCWIMGNINALLTTDEGTQLLETNKYYHKSTGVFAIHLQEAEDNGLHDGIFIITPEDIANADGELCHGEGDISAYVIAVQKYFDELKQNPELLEKMEAQNKLCSDMDKGNIGARFLEIMTGGTSNFYGEFDEYKAQPGITKTRYIYKNYDEIYDIVSNKTGSVTIACGGHCISIIGVKNGNLLVQESNNSEDFSTEYSDKKRDHILFQPTDSVNNQRTYELSKDDYAHYIDEAYILKFK